MNKTICPFQLPDDPLCFTQPSFPFYFSPKPRLLDGISDYALTVVSPLVAYWSLSLFFHYLDMSDWKWLEKYRIHESAEVKSKNLVSRSHVVWAVIVQQIIQTALGLLWLDSEGSVHTPNHAKELGRIATMLYGVLGDRLSPWALARVSNFVYWWAIPIAQFMAAIFIIDTWQYFLHRGMHNNKFLYKQFHSWHHRLYVPYAFGSLYNHPVEGFILDTCGALLAEWATRLSTRQAMLLFIFSTLKTVDDHCGYSLPWDPLQMLTGNNADYHDIHHQVIGIKSNFAQPFFVHWDILLGTRMTRQDIERRRQKATKKE
ncbi:Sphingolipid C4-hydroxylase SUR2 [Psilocybe cubensis]|uniref:Fatty acid hydroxylase domain-containing protein n=2 Tax=Psilocybe cubensis TaxID=181762 RepID=A0A8H7XTM2_PSICU|nr:Sphingolipid C4-hydroxylase SUR2 [Psilocybe cubensis]KAH9479614.1 Sphingolipid C4-hydroxylase SUR2 [Psilocybe cubensis]